MKLAVFDFDGTLFSKDNLPCIGQEWKKQKRSHCQYYKIYLSIIPCLLLYKFKIITRDRFKFIAMNKFHLLFTNMSEIEVDVFFQQAYPNLKQYLNPAIVQEVQVAKDNGYHTVLLSAAYKKLLNIVAKDLGFDTVIATELFFTNGIFDHEKQIPFINGIEKLKLLNEKYKDITVDWEKSISFADSYHDIPILEIVGQPVAVNPDPDLLDYAQKNNWRIIEG